jgi:transcriptional regulator with XRE-family HTH domain
MNNNLNYSEIFVAQRIKQLRLAKKLTQKAFAVSLGIVQGYLSGIEQGKKIPSYTLLMAICHIHGVTEEWLFGGTGGEPEVKPQQREVVPERRERGIPLLNSIPLDFPNGVGEEMIADFILLPGNHEGCFSTVAVGDFMAPTIRDGDLVLFRPGGEVVNRSIVLMTNKWGEVILRRYRIAGEEEYFSPENTAYAPFKADANTKIFGTVIDIWRRVKV